MRFLRINIKDSGVNRALLGISLLLAISINAADGLKRDHVAQTIDGQSPATLVKFSNKVHNLQRGDLLQMTVIIKNDPEILSSGAKPLGK